MTTDNTELVKRLKERARELAGSTLITGQDDAHMLFDAAAKLSTQERVIVELREALERLGSMEAFERPRPLYDEDDELRARIEFARAALSKGSGQSSWAPCKCYPNGNSGNCPAPGCKG